MFKQEIQDIKKKQALGNKNTSISWQITGLKWEGSFFASLELTNCCKLAS